MGSTFISPTLNDENWHLYAGTLSSSGEVVFWRDQVKIDEGVIILSNDVFPKFFALGGSGTNENFSTSEVAEVLIYDRVLSSSELTNLQNYLHSKWLGGVVENFPLLVHLDGNKIPGFNLNTFSDSVSGDLRFYEESVGELIYEIDEWNTSNDALIWVNVPELNSNTKLFAYWGNDLNTTIPTYASDGSLWNQYEAVWHFSSSGEDSTGFSRTATGVNGAVTYGSSLIGNGVTMNEPSYLTTIGYNGIVGNSARSISLWMRSGSGTGSFLGWGDSSDRWDFSLESKWTICRY